MIQNLMPRGMGGSINFLDTRPYDWKQFTYTRKTTIKTLCYMLYYAKLWGII